jgi:hypothetical protein
MDFLLILGVPFLQARNRFNLRGSSTPSDKSSESSDDAVSTTAASRLVKPRPQFSIRPRGRQATSTVAPAAVSESVEEGNAGEPKEETAAAAPAKPTRPAVGGRVNLPNRPNRLGGRPNPLAKLNKAVETEKTVDSVDTEPQPAEKATRPLKSQPQPTEDEQNEASAEVSQQAGLNRLKNRPKIQVHAKVDKPRPTALPRRVNPLLKRKLGASSTTPGE